MLSHACGEGEKLRRGRVDMKDKKAEKPGG